MNVTLKYEGYHRPGNVDQALYVLTKYGDKALVIAGGTDVLPQRPGRNNTGIGKHLVDIAHMGLDYIKEEKDGIHIGAAATINSVGAFPLLSKPSYKVLSEAVACHSTQTIRNRATIGGNLCNASPCADLALPLFALDARLVIKGPKRERQIPIQDFYIGANLSALDNNEILVEICIPFCEQKAGTSFLKLGRQHTAIDMALVNVATFFTMNGQCCDTVRIALGSVGPVPFRAKKAESILAGKLPDKENIQRAAKAAAEASAPLDDIRATAAYRKKMVVILVRQALENSFRRYEA
ncbi:MAG: xanthine dehydrogenase family protein subunit M [Desulfobacterales bacterium]|nr:xanthine dehydrogenase family protein subunit M [Desulfobacterales bacterium]MDX2446031.1 xanthine dehydrogenase family protein subunit M [Desulfobacterales bacterium]